MTPDSTVTTYLAKAGLGQDSVVALQGFLDYLRSKGQYIEAGDLKTQFIERRSVLDRKKVPIAIDRCLVCGHEEYNVNGEP